ncbi:MAG: AlpA family phage regulatory protein [Alcaligenaceae bacterium]|nr:AlpA family phage regulatory protein [Alcaligenaceae bacterium]
MSEHEKTRTRVIRLPECLAMIGLGRSTLFELSNPRSPRYDPTFPKKLRIGQRAVGWLETDICAWIRSKRSSKGD